MGFDESNLVQLVCWLSKLLIDGGKSSLTTITPEIKNQLSYLAGLETNGEAIKRAINFALTHQRDGEID